MSYGRRTRRATSAQLHFAYAPCALVAFEIARNDFGQKAALGDGWWERREAGRRAIEAGERRIAEVAGTEFEQGWCEAVEQFRRIVNAWEAKYPEERVS